MERLWAFPKLLPLVCSLLGAEMASVVSTRNTSDDPMLSLLLVSLSLRGIVSLCSVAQKLSLQICSLSRQT